MDCFRYGDIEEGDFEDIKRFTAAYGDDVLAELRDDRGNTALHMAGGNGHTGTFLSASQTARKKSTSLFAPNPPTSSPEDLEFLSEHR